MFLLLRVFTLHFPWNDGGLAGRSPLIEALIFLLSLALILRNDRTLGPQRFTKPPFTNIDTS